MTQKNTNPAVEQNAVTESTANGSNNTNEASVAKTAAAKSAKATNHSDVHKPDTDSDNNELADGADSGADIETTESALPVGEAVKKAVDAKGELSAEVLELVAELRDTVKRLDPRRHTPKTLKRALSNVADILDDIDTLYKQSE